MCEPCKNNSNTRCMWAALPDLKHSSLSRLPWGQWGECGIDDLGVVCVCVRVVCIIGRDIGKTSNMLGVE